MLKRCNVNIIGPEAKRLKIIRVSHKAPQDVTNFDTGQFVEVFPSKATHDDDIVSREVDSSSSVGLVEDVSSSIFDGGDAQDLVVELDCETVEMVDEGVTSVDVVGSITDAESFSCLPDDENHNHHRVEDEDENDDKHESSPFMTHFVGDGGTNEALDLISNGVVFADGVVKVELSDIGDGFQGDVYNGEAMVVEQPMDITEPLTTLKRLLEERLGCSLETHEVWLQDSVQLDPNRNLVSQCLEGSGIVQINVEIKSVEGQHPRLNIIDVLKPVDDEEEEEDVRHQESVADETNDQMVLANLASTSSTPSSSTATLSSTTFVTKWVVDSWFCQEQGKLKIPRDPALWTSTHVKFWLRWAIKRFNLESVDTSLVNSMDGKRLISLSHDAFTQIFPRDPGDIFWTHLELLRKCKFVAIMHSEETLATALASSTSGNASNIYATNLATASTTTASNRSHKPGGKTRNIRLTLNSGDRTTSASRFGNNGQIQLWQFLLELLTDKDYKDFIQWVGDNGEFKLVNPELIAQLWGHRKNKANMNYEKLSRALRYYYDGDMIAKVHGRRFTYRYVCDLQTLLGYSVAELRQLVDDCAKRSKTHHDVPYLHL